MDVIVDLCVVPLGVGVSVSSQVKRCLEVIEKSGLSYNVHGYGTNIEGEWEAVFSVIKECHQTLHNEGVARISSTVKLGTRIDKAQSITDKIESVKLD